MLPTYTLLYLTFLFEQRAYGMGNPSAQLRPVVSAVSPPQICPPLAYYSGSGGRMLETLLMLCQHFWAAAKTLVYYQPLPSYQYPSAALWGKSTPSQPDQTHWFWNHLCKAFYREFVKNICSWKWDLHIWRFHILYVYVIWVTSSGKHSNCTLCFQGEGNTVF